MERATKRGLKCILLLTSVCVFIQLTGCAALIPAATGFTSGGVTLYKSSTETYQAPVPKMEVVIFKVQIEHNEFLATDKTIPATK